MTTLDLTYNNQVLHFVEAKHPPLVRVKHYQELYGLSTPEWQAKELGDGLVARGLPEYVSLVGSYVLLTPTLQQFGFELLKASAGTSMTEQQVRSSYGWLYADTICFTNKNGTMTKRCDITNTNMSAEYMKQFEVVTGGNYLELLDPNPVSIKGSSCWKVRTFNINEPLPDLTTHDWKSDFRVIKATNSWWEKVSGGILRGVEEFPQLKGKDVPVPLFTNTGYSYIETWKTELVSPLDDIKSVYLPSTLYNK